MKEIHSERLKIVLFQEKHLTKKYVGWLNDDDVVKFSEQRFKRHTIESCKTYWESFFNTPNYFWAIETIKDRIHIGNMNAYIDENNQTADVGILIGEKGYWGKGYGLEAWKAILNFLFEEKNIRKITAGTLENNKGMIKIALQSGMLEEGRRKKQVFINDTYVDMVYFGIFK